jgi:hypothetical protein
MDKVLNKKKEIQLAFQMSYSHGTDIINGLKAFYLSFMLTLLIKSKISFYYLLQRFPTPK